MSLLKDKIELDVQLAELKTQQALQTFPRILRWLLIVCVIAIIPGYFIAKKLSYNYWNKIYSQSLIAAKPSFQNPKAPGTSGISITTAGGSYSAAMEVTNDNVDLALPKADYRFSFFDAAGEQVYQENGSSFLLPNDKKYLVVPRFSSRQPVKTASFRWTSDLHWEKRTSIPAVSIQASQPSVYNQFLPQGFVVEGNYLNNSPYQLGQVRLTFLILDRSGKIIGLSRRDDFTVRPLERRTYKQIWPDVYGDPSYGVKIFPETNTLDRQNLSLPPVPATPASDLSRPLKGR